MHPDFSDHMHPIGDNAFALDDGVYTMTPREFSYETIAQYVARRKDEAELERIYNLG